MSAYEIQIALDPKGIYYDPQDPPHLDDLLYWAELVHQQGRRAELEQWQAPPSLDLGLDTAVVNGGEVYCASAVIPQEPTHNTVQYWRKKPVDRRFFLFKGSINTIQGPYRAYNTPIPVLLCNTLTAYFVGDAARVAEIFSRIRGIGKKSAYGYGKIRSYTVIQRTNDYSLYRDGIAMRWLPDPAGYRLCRPIPPYWHRLERVQMGEVGDEIGDEIGDEA